MSRHARLVWFHGTMTEVGQSFTKRAAATLRLVALQVLAAGARAGVPDVNDAMLPLGRL